eukprot:14980360-Ditylum_brightwellii.AAC.1
MPEFPHTSSAQGTTHTTRNKYVILFCYGSSSKSSLKMRNWSSRFKNRRSRRLAISRQGQESPLSEKDAGFDTLFAS